MSESKKTIDYFWCLILTVLFNSPFGLCSISTVNKPPSCFFERHRKRLGARLSVCILIVVDFSCFLTFYLSINLLFSSGFCFCCWFDTLLLLQLLSLLLQLFALTSILFYKQPMQFHSPVHQKTTTKTSKKPPKSTKFVLISREYR